MLAAPPRERFTFRQAAMPRSFADDVRQGLQKKQKELQPWYFYDPVGSALFGAICELPEYTITRAESEIFGRHGAAMARALRTPDRIIELGSGDSRKTRILLQAVMGRQPRLTYIPIDVDAALLESTATGLLSDFPGLSVDAISADYREVSSLIVPGGRTSIFFLGSSIGNLDPDASAAMLREVRQVIARGDSLLLGADLLKPKEIVEAAYNDSLGVTAAFNLNLLARINRQLGGRFDLATFAHRAFLNQAKSRIEMHLVSRVTQNVAIADLNMEVHFQSGETIHTENSYKYTQSDLETLARDGGFAIEEVWTDSAAGFADVLMAAK